MAELKPAEILKAVQTCGASFCTTDHHECPYGDEGCIDCVDRLEADFEALIAAGDDLIIRRAAPENKPEQAEEMNELAGAGDLIPELPGTGAAHENKRLIDADVLSEEIQHLQIFLSGESLFTPSIKETILRTIDEQATVAAPENKPLTLSELRQMDENTDVEIVPLKPRLWHAYKEGISTNCFETYRYEDYGKTWLAYARKPEGSE